MAPFVVGLGFQAPKVSELGQINSLDGPFSVLTVPGQHLFLVWITGLICMVCETVLYFELYKMGPLILIVA